MLNFRGVHVCKATQMGSTCIPQCCHWFLTLMSMKQIEWNSKDVVWNYGQYGLLSILMREEIMSPGVFFKGKKWINTIYLGQFWQEFGEKRSVGVGRFWYLKTKMQEFLKTGGKISLWICGEGFPISFGGKIMSMFFHMVCFCWDW